MLKWLVVVTVLFSTLIFGLVHDALAVYSVTHYVDVMFLSSLGAFLLFVYGVVTYMVVLSYKY